MPTPFEAGKTAKELGIDKRRKFVVVDEIDPTHGALLETTSYYPWSKDAWFRDVHDHTKCYLLPWFSLAYADDAEEPVREEEHLLGYDVGKEGGDKTVALYGKRHEDGSVEITKTVRGLPLETPYEPRVGDRVVLEGEVKEIEEGRRLTVELLPSAGEIYLYPIDVANGVLKRLSRKPPRTLTKAEAEALLTEKLGESVEIE